MLLELEKQIVSNIFHLFFRVFFFFFFLWAIWMSWWQSYNLKGAGRGRANSGVINCLELCIFCQMVLGSCSSLSFCFERFFR